jgi:hypothetical protein
VLIYCFLSPQALNGKNMGILPKSGRCKKIIRVVKELLLDWFNNFFVREVGWYLKSKNLVFHPILLLDNATGNVQYLGFFHSNIQVEHLDKNTNKSFLQLLDKQSLQNWRALTLTEPCMVSWMQVTRKPFLVSVNARNSTA